MPREQRRNLARRVLLAEFRVCLRDTVKFAADLADIRVLDHIVVGDGVCVSFAGRWLL